MAEGKLGLDRDELISVLFMALLFIAVLGGRELGSIYGSFQEVSKLSVVLQLDEEETAEFLDEVLQGEEPDLEVGVALTLPSVTNVEGMVPRLPDYTRKWLISVTVAPVLVHPPEVSTVEIDIIVEDEIVQTVAFDFGREKIHYLIFDEGSDVPLHTDVKTVSVAPDSKATYTFQFTPTEAGRYYYILEAADAFNVNASSTNILIVEDST